MRPLGGERHEERASGEECQEDPDTPPNSCAGFGRAELIGLLADLAVKSDALRPAQRSRGRTNDALALKPPRLRTVAAELGDLRGGQHGQGMGHVRNSTTTQGAPLRRRSRWNGT
jgi:hypothetical protein